MQSVSIHWNWHLKPLVGTHHAEDGKKEGISYDVCRGEVVDVPILDASRWVYECEVVRSVETGDSTTFLLVTIHGALHPAAGHPADNFTVSGIQPLAEGDLEWAGCVTVCGRLDFPEPQGFLIKCHGFLQIKYVVVFMNHFEVHTFLLDFKCNDDYENPAMGIYFIADPDGYWLEIVP